MLTAENSAEVLPRFFHLSRREAAEVAAAIRPVERPPLRDVVTVVACTVDSAAYRDIRGTRLATILSWFSRLNHSFG